MTRERPPCTKCGHDYLSHPWSETHHSGCDETDCTCKGYEEE